MGFFKKLLGNDEETKKEEKVLPWIFLTDIGQLEEIKKESFSKPQVIFKHSTRCGISTMVMNKFVKYYEINHELVNLHYLDLLSYRDVSDEVGYTFGVMHQSPQLLIVKNGEVVKHNSHYDINANEIFDFV